MKTKAVFFDLFETLITEFENGKRKALRTLNFVEQLGIDAKSFEKEWKSRQVSRMNGTYSNFSSVLKDIFNVLGYDINEDFIETLHRERVDSKSIPFNNIDESIISMLEHIKSRKLRLCLISNCAPEEIIGWESSALSKYFDDVIFSYQVKLAKPNPLIYHLACERIGVSPSESVFLGDGGSQELDGASEVGMRSFHATWFIPPFISEKITGYPKLNKPSDIINYID